MEILSNDCVERIKFLQFRGIIIEEKVSQIVDSIETLERYKEMLNTIDFVIYHDENFFLLENYCTKTLSLLRECSVKYSTSGKVRERENEIIGDLNKVLHSPFKENDVNEYYKLEKKLRLNLPITNEDVLDSMAGDYNVVNQILKAAISDHHIKNISCRQFVESTEFLLASIPQLYEECPLSIQMSEEYLEEMPKVKDFKLNRCIHKVKKELKNF